MQAIYKVTTKYNSHSNGQIRNVNSFNVLASNMKQAITKTEKHLKKNDSGAEYVDSVEFITEIDF